MYLTNSGHPDSHMIGDFPNLGKVWYNKELISKFFSIAIVCKVSQVTMDTNDKLTMYVHHLDGSIMIFKEHESGLYLYKPKINNNCVNGYSMLYTLAAQKRLFLQRELKASDAAMELHWIIVEF